MPLVERLRRWLAVIAVVFSLFVAGVYLRTRWRQTAHSRPSPGKIAVELKRTANGFEYDKSEGGRTILRIRAAEVKEFKLNGHTALSKVSITLYGKDSSRFDRIYGDDFSYDPQSGDVVANGEVQIDLEANPAGLLNPDQAPPEELKSPIHLKASGLTFNRNTGDAFVNGRVEFTSEQASGWAEGLRYQAVGRSLTLVSQIHAVLTGPQAAVLTAARGTVSGDPRQLVLDQPTLDRHSDTLRAASAAFIFGAANKVTRVVANGAVHAEISQQPGESVPARSTLDAERAEFAVNSTGNQLASGLVTGHVLMNQAGAQPMQASAARLALEFSGAGRLQRVKAQDQVRLHFGAVDGAIPGQRPAASENDYEITAQAIDFDVSAGGRLQKAVTQGPAQITLASAGTQQKSAGGKTVVTAGQFEAMFGNSLPGTTRLVSIHGEPDARIASQTPGQPERVSTSQRVDAEFAPDGQLASVTQQGNFHYLSGEDAAGQLQAFSDRARFTSADQMVTLTGTPRIVGQNMTTTAQTVRINRATGEAFALGDIKSTYVSPNGATSPSAGGALLGSRAPIHVTAAAMKATSNPSLVVYSGGAIGKLTGKARLWQESNMIEAPEIDFDNTHRMVVASGTEIDPATTTFVQPDKGGKSTPIQLTGLKLTYTDSDGLALYEGGVSAKGQDFTAVANSMRVYLAPGAQAKQNKSFTGSNRLQRMVANGAVDLEQLGRKATGEQLVYTPDEEKFVLTGGPPSIFDAERGKITGDSLTFYRRDARVLVEGESKSPVVTQTRVAR